MLPKIAMPSAPPSSALVSESAPAAPARSGGAVPMTMSVVSVTTGAVPRATKVVAIANQAKDVDSSITRNISEAAAATANPAAMSVPRDHRFTSAAHASEPTTNRSEEHTSELQSRQYIVCRLLLEKKNK